MGEKCNFSPANNTNSIVLCFSLKEFLIEFDKIHFKIIWNRTGKMAEKVLGSIGDKDSI